MITIVNVFESKIQNIHTLIFKTVMKFCIKSNHECSFYIYQNKLCNGNLPINIILIQIINHKKALSGLFPKVIFDETNQIYHE